MIAKTYFVLNIFFQFSSVAQSCPTLCDHVFFSFFFWQRAKGVCMCVCVCLWLGELWPVVRTDLFPGTPAPHAPRKGFQVYKRTSPSSPLRASSAPSGPEQLKEEGLECVGSRLPSTSISFPPPSHAFCSFRSEK